MKTLSDKMAIGGEYCLRKSDVKKFIKNILEIIKFEPCNMNDRCTQCKIRQLAGDKLT